MAVDNVKSLNEIVDDVISFVFKLDFSSKLIALLTLDNRIIIPLNEGSLHFKVIHSVMIDNGMNVIKFESDELCFLVFQHVSSSDFIYFPKLALFKFYCHVNKEISENSLNKYYDKIKKEPVFEVNCNNTFGGVIASHGRPAHFFYDTALGVQKIYEDGCFKKISKIYQMNGSQFVKFENIYRCAEQLDSESVSYEEINDKALNNEKFFLKVSAFYGEGDNIKRGLLNRFDDRFRAMSKDVSSDVISKIKDLKSEGYFILWHGITTAKRRWIEQEESVLLLADKLRKLNYKVCLIIDGWTCPLNKTALDFNEVNEDSKVFERILKGAHKDTVCLSVIGADPTIKLSVSNLIDFHISNGGTGSLYVSRISKKPGILHIANSTLKMCEQSIHYNSCFIPKEYVLDIEESTIERVDYISYSIDPEVFSDLALNKMKLNPELEIKINKIKLVSKFEIKIKKIINCISGNNLEYISINNDPIVLFDIENISLEKDDLVKVEVFMDTDVEDAFLKPKLYVDYANGFNEQDTIFASYCEGRATFELLLNHNLHNLRFDPFPVIGEFTIQKVILTVTKT